MEINFCPAVKQLHDPHGGMIELDCWIEKGKGHPKGHYDLFHGVYWQSDDGDGPGLYAPGGDGPVPSRAAKADADRSEAEPVRA